MTKSISVLPGSTDSVLQLPIVFGFNQIAGPAPLAGDDKPIPATLVLRRQHPQIPDPIVFQRCRIRGLVKNHMGNTTFHRKISANADGIRLLRKHRRICRDEPDVERLNIACMEVKPFDLNERCQSLTIAAGARQFGA